MMKEKWYTAPFTWASGEVSGTSSRRTEAYLTINIGNNLDLTYICGYQNYTFIVTDSFDPRAAAGVHSIL